MEISILGKMREYISKQESKVEDNPIIFFTWNPHPRYDGWTYERKWKFMYEILSHIRLSSEVYVFVPEITDQGRLHCHGWLVISNKVNWIRFQKYVRRYGFIKIPYARNKQKVFDYVRKDLETTIGVLTTNYYPITPQTNDMIGLNIRGDKKIKEKKEQKVLKSKDITKMFGI